ncbi:MAG: 2-hydroxyacid dehydrogenase [Patescibacteria group bacterium]|nr:2-hydroxyacid dehydrogenase [Patescibacteria group bacterium]MDD4610448.1 2-hydroxyacid dehydrogenase [Patescibacteria group bacterium]
MKFNKIILYDLKSKPLEDEFINKLKEYAVRVEIIFAEKEYAQSLKPEDAKGADAIITRLLDFYADKIFTRGTLKFITTMHTDFSNFKLALLRQNGITLSNVPGYSTEAVAELTVSALLNISRRTHDAMNFVKQGNWGFEKFMGWELKGKTLGIIGLGKIGGRVAEICQCFGMNIVYFSKVRKSDSEQKGIKFAELDVLLRESDAISLHCSLNNETEQILNKARLQLMKPGAVLLDPGRSELVDLEAVFELCKEKKIYAWFEAIEDKNIRDKFGVLDNVYLTPHFGWMTEEAQWRLREITLSNIKAYLDDSPVNRII